MDTTPEVAAEQPSELPKEAPVETPAAPQEPTVAQILESQQTKPNLIPEAAFLDEKKGRKEAEKRAKELESQLAAMQKAPENQSRAEISADVSAILDEYGLDDTNKQFFNKLVSAVESRNKGEIETLRTTLSEMTQKEQKQSFEAAFQTHYEAALEQVPEYKGIAKPNVIKALTLDPANKDKTFVQIIEEAYDGAVPGKRSVESTRPGGLKDPEPIDYARAREDASYLEGILSDPTKKAEYNSNLHKRVRF